MTITATISGAARRPAPAPLDLRTWADTVLGLARYTAVTLDGQADTGDPDLPRRLRAEALLTLSTLTTPAPWMSWAAGVVTARHASVFLRPIQAHSFTVDAPSGGALDDDQMYHVTRSGFCVTAKGRVVTRVRWEQVADLFGPDTIPPDLRSQINAAAEERIMYTTESSLDTSDQAWDDIEQRCRLLAARVWVVARPKAVPTHPASSEDER